MIKTTDSFLKKIDIFGTQIEFTKDNIPKLRTSFGGVLTLLAIAIFVLFFYINVRELSLRENPNTLNYFRYEKENIPYFTVNPNSFPFGLSVLDEAMNKLDPTLVNVTIRQQEVYLNLSDFQIGKREIEYPAVKCDPSHFDSSYKVSPSDYLYMDYCWSGARELVFGNTQDNVFSGKAIKNVHIVIKYCQNNTNIVCKPESEIQKRLVKANVGFIFGTNFINTKKHDDPFEKFLKIEYDQVDPNIRKDIASKLKVTKLVDDTGFLWPSISEKVNFNDLTSRSTTAAITAELDFYTRNISFEAIVNYYDRTYIRIYQVLAQSKIMFDIFVIACLIFMNFYSKNEMFSHYLNCLYNFSQLENNNQNNLSLNKIIDKKSEPEKNGKQKFNDDIMKKSNENVIVEVQQISSSRSSCGKEFKSGKEFQELEKKYGTLTLSFWNNLIFSFCPCSKSIYNDVNLLYLRLLNDIIKKKFEFSNFLKVCEDLRKLKIILLSRDQMIVSEFIGKPNYCFENNSNDRILLELEEEELREEFGDALKRLKCEKDSISKKILKCLDDY